MDYGFKKLMKFLKLKFIKIKIIKKEIINFFGNYYIINIYILLNIKISL